MLSLGGVIGTGLFFNTGYIISTTGAAGTLLAYLIGALVVWLVMQCLGELSVAMPETGAFHVYAGALSWPGDGLYRGVALLANVDGGAGVELHRGGILHAVLVPAGAGLESGAWCSAQ
ncbi:S-methylmethionine permease [Klebsiella pneumoniae]|uniref:S-methylmethionine permease n=1 Tax=Klebsiella pneumoniae TaxID=573 RepID=A0A378AVY6_KLEPN|nr:S-methylmethionine permease [Klebsiella pneumoniae]